jgi:nucleoside-diphosphate-sugar epimerase
MSRVAVLGATGFVGRAVMEALQREAHEVVALRAPRLAPMAQDMADAFIRTSRFRQMLATELDDVDAVINAAGDPRATVVEGEALVAANGVLPGLIASVVTELPKQPRLVHVSSASVQGNAPVLDDRPARLDDSFSAYSRSKVIGELLVLKHCPEAIVYRPPGVHAADRNVTQAVARLARSPLSSVAKPASSPTAQALLFNVADAIAFLGTTTLTPPSIVLHPSENLTTGGLLTALGGRTPRELPRWAAHTVLLGLTRAERAAPRLAGHRRRLEMLWFGQAQASSWLTVAEWIPPADMDAWQDLGLQLAGTPTGKRRRPRTADRPLRHEVTSRSAGRTKDPG